MHPCSHQACTTPLSTQVHVHVPEQLAASLPFQSLRLELWSSNALISTSTVLALPATLPAVAAEVHELQAWHAEGEAHEVAQFLEDAAVFMEGWGMGQGSDGWEAEGEGGVWDGGCELARQAVLWGLPGLATLLVGRLMALPPCGPATTPARFAQLAHATAAAAAAAAQAEAAAVGGGGAEDGGQQQEQDDSLLSLEQLGGLLHLALLSPSPGRMLQAVLGWGRQYGSVGGTGFAWRWGEHSSLGLTPLCILATHGHLLQHVLQDPAEGPALKEAAAAAAAGAAGAAGGAAAAGAAAAAPPLEAKGSAGTLSEQGSEKQGQGGVGTLVEWRQEQCVGMQVCISGKEKEEGG